MTRNAPRSRAHRTLLFQYLLGISLIGFGLFGMAAMQAQLLLMKQATVQPQSLTELWPDGAEFAPDDARSLSDSLRVCGDGLDRPVELDCWHDQLASLLPRSTGLLERHRVLLDGREIDVLVTGRGGDGDAHEPGIVISDAADGTLLWQLAGAVKEGYDPATRRYAHPLLRDPVARRVAVMDADRDGLADRIYAGDEGGTLWRIDLAGAPEGSPRRVESLRADDRGLWQVTPLFNAGKRANDLALSPINDRRFVSSPDIVQAADRQGRYDAVMLGSSSPADEDVENWFYMIKDRAVVSGLPASRGMTHTSLEDLTERCSSAESCERNLDLQRGWKIRLAANGERFSGHAVTAAGNVFFTTWTQLGDPCSGRRMLYALSLRDARPVLRVDSTVSRDPVATDIIDIVERATGGGGVCNLAQSSP